MEIDRRTLLASLGAAALTGAAPADGAPAFIAAARDRDGFAGYLIDADGRILCRAPLPRRGHGAAVCRTAGLAVLFARRLGDFAVVFDLVARRVAGGFAPPADRKFYGHGCFSADGRLLYAAENDFDAGRGAIGVYDVQAGFKRIGEFDSGGIGPHQILLLPDGRTIAAANGGIATHPDLPRMKLNLADMRPNLAYVDVETGAVQEVAEARRDLRQLSIRHIAAAPDGSVWWGGQYEGPAGDLPPLVGMHRRGGEIEIVGASDRPDMRNYVGSVAVRRDGARAATTCPRGGVMYIWDTRSLDLVERRAMADVCGVAAGRSGFVESDGLGRLHRDGAVIDTKADFAWDNHLTAI